MRAQADAVLIGAGTARSDDPVLDVRGLGDGHVNPVRVVAAGTLDLPLSGRLAETAGSQPLWLCHHGGAAAEARAVWAARGAELIEVPEAAAGGLDTGGLLAALGARGLTRVLCEGGGQLAAALLSGDLVDELVVYSAGMVLGGDGRPAVAGLRLAALADARRFRLIGAEPVGADIRSRWERVSQD